MDKLPFAGIGAGPGVSNDAPKEICPRRGALCLYRSGSRRRCFSRLARAVDERGPRQREGPGWGPVDFQGRVGLLQRGRGPWLELGPQKSYTLFREAANGREFSWTARRTIGSRTIARARQSRLHLEPDPRRRPALSFPDGPKGRRSGRSKKVRARRSPLRCDPKGADRWLWRSSPPSRPRPTKECIP
jgi:hypothetical protein